MTSWADQFNTYQDACDFYGCDGPRELAIEARIEAEQGCIDTQDWMEAHGRPFPDWRWKYRAVDADPDFIPF